MSPMVFVVGLEKLNWHTLNRIWNYKDYIQVLTLMPCILEITSAYFNGHFSFTTLGVSLDDKYTNMKSGVYTFRAHGQIYHSVFSFGRTEDGPKHLDLYFYDDDPNLQHRFRRSPNLDQGVIRRVVDILKDNPYSQVFRNLGRVDDLEEYHIELNIDMRLDQRRYNLPISSEVAAVWVESNDNKRYRIYPYYGCYDLLSYPLFFPRGEITWHTEIPKVGVSLDEILRSCRNHRQNQGYYKLNMCSLFFLATINLLLLTSYCSQLFFQLIYEQSTVCLY